MQLSTEVGDFEDSPLLSPAFEKLEVITHVMSKLNKALVQKANKMSVLSTKTLPPPRAFLSFPTAIKRLRGH